jgi:hypothetical protein
VRLSTAISLGRVLLKSKAAGRFNGSHAGPDEGCALDMALAAVGVKSDSWSDCLDTWPWLREACSMQDTWAYILGITFDNSVMIWKSMTMEQFIDFVRDCEPPEDSPEVDLQIQSPALQAEEIEAT